MDAHGFYSYLSNIPADNIVNYGVLTVFIVILSHRLQLSGNTLLGLAVSILVSYYLYDREQTVGSSYLNRITHQLNSPIIRDGKYLYLDSEIVNLLFRLQTFRDDNNMVYRDLVKEVDNFMRIYRRMEKGSAKPGKDFELATDSKEKALNILHSLVHSSTIEKTPLLNRSRDELESLLNEHLDKMYIYMRYSYGQGELDQSVKIIRKNEPSGRDPLMNSHWNFY